MSPSSCASSALAALTVVLAGCELGPGKVPGPRWKPLEITSELSPRPPAHEVEGWRVELTSLTFTETTEFKELLPLVKGKHATFELRGQLHNLGDGVRQGSEVLHTLEGTTATGARFGFLDHLRTERIKPLNRARWIAPGDVAPGQPRLFLLRWTMAIEERPTRLTCAGRAFELAYE